MGRRIRTPQPKPDTLIAVWGRCDRHAAEIARLKSALAESEAAAEGALMILVQTQAERDAALAQAAALREVVKFHERLTVDPSTLSRRDAQMRAEGMLEAAEVYARHPLIHMAGYFDLKSWRHEVYRAILAAAEKGPST